MKNKILAQSEKGNGLLPMKQSEKQEAKKSSKQKSIELCNFIKNAFCVDGNVYFVKFHKKIQSDTGFLVEDSERGNFIVVLLK